MAGVVVIDANVLALLIVGTASRDYIAIHKNTKDDFNEYDFDLVSLLVSGFSEIVLIAHVVAETSNLIRQIGDPRRTELQRVFASFVAQSYEIPIASTAGFDRPESVDLGVTDAILLHLCAFNVDDRDVTLLTTDGPLTDRARARNYSVINYKREFQI